MVMSASASSNEVVLPGRAIRLVRVEAALAVAAFAALCAVVLSVRVRRQSPMTAPTAHRSWR
jgi:uncharacterized membrane protein